MSVRRDPFEQMEAMFDQMRRNAFESWPDQSRPALAPGRTGDVAVEGEPAFDAGVSLEERDGAYVVMADIPGFERDEIELTFEDGRLTISGTHEEDDESGFRRRRVHESVSVPGDVVLEDAAASYHNGVLEVTLPMDDDGDDAHVIDIE